MNPTWIWLLRMNLASWSSNHSSIGGIEGSKKVIPKSKPRCFNKKSNDSRSACHRKCQIGEETVRKWWPTGGGVTYSEASTPWYSFSSLLLFLLLLFSAYIFFSSSSMILSLRGCICFCLLLMLRDSWDESLCGWVVDECVGSESVEVRMEDERWVQREFREIKWWRDEDEDERVAERERENGRLGRRMKMVIEW